MGSMPYVVEKGPIWSNLERFYNEPDLNAFDVDAERSVASQTAHLQRRRIRAINNMMVGRNYLGEGGSLLSAGNYAAFVTATESESYATQ